MPSVDVRLTGSEVDRRRTISGCREGRGDCVESGKVEEAAVANSDTASDDIVVCVRYVTMPLAREKVGVKIAVF
jgi:hypothetical protein